MTRLRLVEDVDEAASLWLARRRLGEDFDEAEFQAWLAADPRHAAAYAEMSRAAGLVSELAELGQLSATPKRRVPWIAGSLAAAAAAALFVFVAPVFDAPDALYATEIAEIREVELPDGSVVTLAPDSQLELHFSARLRRVELTQGEAFFDVAADAGRPFLVEAGGADVRVVGTQFNVRRGGEAVRVSVAEGVVRLSAAPMLPVARPEPVLLHAGERAEVAERAALLGAAPAPAVSRFSPDTTGAWREGHLSYVEAPLSELVADLNRYYAPGVRLTEPGLGEFRLTASFRADDLETFFSTLPAAAPVTVTRGAGGEVVIAPAR